MPRNPFNNDEYFMHPETSRNYELYPFDYWGFTDLYYVYMEDQLP